MSRDNEPVRSQELEAPPAPEPQVESPLPEATSDPDNQEATEWKLLEAFSDHRGHKSLELEPMEVDALDPPGRVQTIQRPIYYISEVIHDAKTRYLEVLNLLYAVLIASKNLCHYF
jgi:hypothetical protein